MIRRYVVVDAVEDLIGACNFSLKACLPSGRMVVLAECDDFQWARLQARASQGKSAFLVVPPLSAPAHVLPLELQSILPQGALAPPDDILVALRNVREALGIPVQDWLIDKDS